MIIGIRVPVEVGRVLEQQEVPGEPHSASDMHVTVLYVDKASPILDVAKTMIAAHAITSKNRPFQITIQDVSSFPRNPDDGLPIICFINSPELQAIHYALKAEFDRLQIPYRHKYPEYKPHVTLSYVKEETPEGYVFNSSLPGPISFTVYELSIMGYADDAHVRVELPLSLTMEDRIASRLIGH
jgi:2'-5' RNA ligase